MHGAAFKTTSTNNNNFMVFSSSDQTNIKQSALWVKSCMIIIKPLKMGRVGYVGVRLGRCGVVMPCIYRMSQLLFFLCPFQRSKLIFSISRLLATFIFKMVANGKFRSPKIVVSLTQDTSCYLHEGATAERCVRK